MAEVLAAVRGGALEEVERRRGELSPHELVRLELALAYREGDLSRAYEIAAALWNVFEADAVVAAVLVEGDYPELAAPAGQMLQRAVFDAALDVEPCWQRLAQAPGDLEAWTPLLANLIAANQELAAVDGVARALAEGHGDFSLWAALVELLLAYRRRNGLLRAIELARRAFPDAPAAAATVTLIWLGLGDLAEARLSLARIDPRAVEQPLVLAARAAVAEATSQDSSLAY
jgi:hypothetical protein